MVFSIKQIQNEKEGKIVDRKVKTYNIGIPEIMCLSYMLKSHTVPFYNNLKAM